MKNEFKWLSQRLLLLEYELKNKKIYNFIKSEVNEDFEIYFSIYRDKNEELLIIKSLYDDDKQGVVSLSCNEKGEIVNYNLILNLENRIFVSGLKLEENNRPLLYLYTYNYSLCKYGLFDVGGKDFVIDEVSDNIININDAYDVSYEISGELNKVNLFKDKDGKIRKKEI